MTSPFASIAPALVANGFSAIPIRPDGKMPGAYAGDEWRIMRGWNRFCGELPGEFQLRLWSKWPNANVGVACGRGVLAFDIDREDMVEAILAVLPPVMVGKKGRKGVTVFYRGDTNAIRSRGFKIDGFGVMDLISDGKQTVLPPSIHPDTGLPYEWTTERTLADTRPAELPECTAAHFEAVLDVLRAHGWEEDKTYKIIPGDPRQFAEDVGDDMRDWFRKLNDDALANLDAWVPRLGLTRLVSQGDGYRSVAEWRPSNSGKPLGKRNLLLSINPKGIVDYGDGEKGYTPLNLVMAAFDMPDSLLDKASLWLGEALGYDFQPKYVLNRNRPKDFTPPPRPGAATPEPAPFRPSAAAEDDEPPPEDGPAWPIAEAMALAAPLAFPGDEAARTPNVVSLPAAAEAAESDDDDFDDLCRVPGLVGDIVEWILATSAAPCRPLALAASLALVGALAGRNYATEETDLRTNIYTLGLAPSGFGKAQALRCINKIVERAVLDEWLGGDDIASGAGLRKRVEAHPAILYAIDEFGGFMKKISDSRNAHTHEIRNMLLRYYSAADNVYRGTDYAGERGKPCHNPNVCLYGAATPTDFWEACRSRAVNDGFLPRLLVFRVGGALPKEVRPAASKNDVPAAILDGCRDLTRNRVGGNMNGRLADGSTSSIPLEVPLTSAARDMYYADRGYYRDLAYRANGVEEPILSRVVETGMKVALILAIGVDANRPVITAGLWRAGMRLSRYCARDMIAEVSGRVADNDRQREYLDVKRWIDEAGALGLTFKAIAKRVNGRFNDARLNEILASLRDSPRAVGAILYQNPKGGPKTNRFVAARFLDQPDADAG